MATCSECTYLKLNDPDYYGKFWCELKYERHAANELECYRFCKAYTRSENTANSAYNYSIEHSKETGCFITTITCNILKINDKHIFLENIRNLRNNYLQKNNLYKPLLAEYDIIGPKIAKSLSNDPLKLQISINLLYKYIIPISNLIKDNKFDEAINEYKKMTNTLKKIYGYDKIEINIQDIENIDINNSGHGIYKVKELKKSPTNI